jgi:hypothetical protein
MFPDAPAVFGVNSERIHSDSWTDLTYDIPIAKGAGFEVRYASASIGEETNEKLSGAAAVFEEAYQNTFLGVGLYAKF